MNKQNDIDQLFESKLNNQTFELKDAYLANFETQLDMYNNKGKGLIWIVFVSLIAFTLLYDFVLLPKQNKNSSYKVRTIKAIHFDNGNGNHQKLNSSNKKANYSNSIPFNKKENLSKNHIDKHNNKIIHKTNIYSVPNIITPIKIKKQANKELEQEFVQSTLEEVTKETLNTKENLNLTEKKIETIKTPDVYLDDTIRRQVIIIDTIVKRDTIIINDTIKNKIRLFKKKR